MVPSHNFRSRSYTIGWITATPVERAAAKIMLDEMHGTPPDFLKHQSDHNSYSWGRTGEHRVVIASLPAGENGTVSAAVTASGLCASLPHIRLGLLVGTGSGVPSGTTILLGDVVVSNPSDSNGGVVQYDLYKAQVSQDRQRHELNGFLEAPPRPLRSALAVLQSELEISDSPITKFLARFEGNPRAREPYAYPGNGEDPLRRELIDVRREPEIHYGTIASGNTLVEDAQVRDDLLEWLLSQNITPKCFETEAAGLMNRFPCMVVRGICNYADGGTGDLWTRYAASTAACFAKELLQHLDPQEVELGPTIGDLMDKVDRVQGVVDEIALQTEKLAIDSQAANIKSWLCPSDPSTNYNDAMSLRHEGTGAWLLNSKTFGQFKAGTLPSLWLHGKPGCGKTILASTIIRDLSAKETGSKAALFFFFFDSRDPQKQTVADMLRALIFQLYCNPRMRRDSVIRSYNSFSYGTAQPSEIDLIRIFDDGIEQSSGTTDRSIVVLDAMDESTTRSKLLSWIRKTQSTSVQFCLTSLKEYDIERSIKVWLRSESILSFQQSRVDQDIALFIRGELRDPERFDRWQERPEVLREIENVLVTKSEGMFRWAACQLHELCKCLDLPSLRRALQCLPRDLNETYTRTLLSIPKTHEGYAIRLLQFLLFARANLRLEDAVEILAIYPEEELAFDASYRMPTPMEITKYCQGLIHVTRAGHSGSSMLTRVPTLQLAHGSVKEYLLSQTANNNYRSALQRNVANAAIVEVYLAYFFARYHESNISEGRTLFSAASSRWLEHAQAMGSGFQGAESWIEKLLNTPKAYSKWVKSLPLAWTGRYGADLPPLCCTALFGLVQPTKRLLELGHDVNTTYDGLKIGICALAAAASAGHYMLVLTLLNAGADANLGTRTAGYPLALACAHGHLEVTKLLIERGASLFTQDNLGMTPLHLACAGGHDKIAQFLLDTGSEPNNSNGRIFGTPLAVAVRNNHMATAGTLYKKGAKIGPALLEAAQLGEVRMMRHLLTGDFDIDIDRTGSGSVFDGNALEGACCNRHAAVVGLLLDFGANINFQSKGLHGNALVAACWGGDIEIVRMLIDRGASLETPGTDGYNALQAACKQGNLTLATLLLQRGASVNSDGVDPRERPIAIARRRADGEMSDLLIQNGAS